MTNTLYKQIASLGAATIALFTVGSAIAGDGPETDGRTTLRNAHIKLDYLIDEQNVLETEIEEGFAALNNKLEIEVDLDPTFCAAGPSQCLNFGAQGAMDGNNHPVNLVVFVKRGGAPVPDIPFEQFELDSTFVGPGGSRVEFCSVIDCTGDAMQQTGGVYAFRLVQFNLRNWVDGRYQPVISVTDDGETVSKLASFSIPSTP